MSCESCIHYKFFNITDYSTIKFNGFELSLGDLKMKILQAKRMTQSPLQIINAQNKNAYVDDSEMIPRNTSVIVKRIPGPPKRRNEGRKMKVQEPTVLVGNFNEESDLTKIDISEDNKIEEMMNRATKVLEKKPIDGKYTPVLRCFNCDQIGHYKDKCPLLPKSRHFEIKRKHPTLIPSTIYDKAEIRYNPNLNSTKSSYTGIKKSIQIPPIVRDIDSGIKPDTESIQIDNSKSSNINQDLSSPNVSSSTSNPSQTAVLSQKIEIDSILSESNKDSNVEVSFPLLSKSEFYQQQSIYQKKLLSKVKSNLPETKPKISLLLNKSHSKRNRLSSDKTPESCKKSAKVLKSPEIDTSKQPKIISFNKKPERDTTVEALSVNGKCMTKDLDDSTNEVFNEAPSSSTHAKTDDIQLGSSLNRLTPDLRSPSNPDKPITQLINISSTVDNTMDHEPIGTRLVKVHSPDLDVGKLDPVVPGASKHVKRIEMPVHKSNEYNRSRLPSTVKKISRDSSISHLKRRSSLLENDILTPTSSGFIPDTVNLLSESGEIDNDDSSSSEFEEGQIDSHESMMSTPIFNDDNELNEQDNGYDRHRTFSQKNNLLDSEPRDEEADIEEKSHFKFSMNPRNRSKIPDRIVMIKSSRPRHQPSRVNEVSTYKRNFKRRHSDSRPPASLYQRIPRNTQSRLMMTRNKDKRIVEIKTRKNKTNSKNKLQLLRRYSRDRNTH